MSSSERLGRFRRGVVIRFLAIIGVGAFAATASITLDTVASPPAAADEAYQPASVQTVAPTVIDRPDLDPAMDVDITSIAPAFEFADPSYAVTSGPNVRTDGVSLAALSASLALNGKVAPSAILCAIEPDGPNGWSGNNLYGYYWKVNASDTRIWHYFPSSKSAWIFLDKKAGRTGTIYHWQRQYDKCGGYGWTKVGTDRV